MDEWKKYTYVFEILDQRTEHLRGTVSVQANGYLSAEELAGDWLDEHPGMMLGGYTKSENPPPALQQWVIE